MLEYEASTHTYTLDGTKVPSVTTLLKNSNIIKTSFYTNRGADNGKRRHLLTELYDLGSLDWGSIADEDMNYLSAWIKAKQDLNVVVSDSSEIEVKLYSVLMGYAGTADRICVVNGERTVVDIKTGAKEKWHSLQLILYALAYSEIYEQPRPKMMGIYLKKNGRYSFTEHNYDDAQVAMAAVRIQKWKDKK